MDHVGNPLVSHVGKTTALIQRVGVGDTGRLSFGVSPHVLPGDWCTSLRAAGIRSWLESFFEPPITRALDISNRKCRSGSGGRTDDNDLRFTTGIACNHFLAVGRADVTLSNDDLLGIGETASLRLIACDKALVHALSPGNPKLTVGTEVAGFVIAERKTMFPPEPCAVWESMSKRTEPVPDARTLGSHALSRHPAFVPFT